MAITLLERVGDREPYVRANAIHKKLVKALEGVDITKPPFKLEWMDENVSYSAPLYKLGVVDYNDFDSDLAVGVILGDDKNPVSNGEFYSVDVDFTPGGMILLGFNRVNRKNLAYSRGFKRQAQLLKFVGSDKWTSAEDIDAAALFSAMKSVFIHEYIHYHDFTLSKKARKYAQYGINSIEKRQDIKDETAFEKSYFTSPVETNANFHQAFAELVDLFEDMFVNPTRDDAKKFAPSPTKLWDRFVEELEPGLVGYHTSKELLKLYGARLVSAWEEYVNQLS
jgi:hypothetical protein